MAHYTKLHVFDFDGTLFRSPTPPSWWTGKNWWMDPMSLNPPMVPETPDQQWWNEDVVQRALEAYVNPDNFVILLTARSDGYFHSRVHDLVEQKGLVFERIYLSPGHDKAEDYKIKVMEGILKEFPTIRGVSIWEDRETHLRLFADWVESGGRACFPHLVTATPHEVLGGLSATRVAARYQEKKKVPAKDGGKTTVYVYSERQIANRNREKAKRVESLRKQIGDLRACVKEDLKSKDDHKRLVALAVALMDETCERVGNHDSAKDGHYGVTGWCVKHISTKGDKVTLKYVGKSGVDHEKIVETKPVVSLVKDLVKDKKKGDRLLTLGEVEVHPEDVNEYLSKFDITAKDIRGFRANDEMCKALKAVRAKGPKELPHARKEKDKILKAEFKEALELVAEIVGHTETILRNSYLTPNLEPEYIKDGTVITRFSEKSASVVVERWLSHA